MHTMQISSGQQHGFSHPPAVHYQVPDDVLNDQGLDPLQKRAILSSWASDLFAVESCPWLRKVPGVKAILRLSDILAALRALDDEEPPPGGTVIRLASSRSRELARLHRRPRAVAARCIGGVR